MDMGGTVWVAAHQPQQVGRRPGCVDGVLGGLEAVEPEFALVIGLELAPEVVSRLVLWVEHIVFAVGAGLPHVEGGIRDTLACIHILHDSVEEGDLTIRGHVLDAGGTELPEWCFGRPERTEDG